MTKNYKAVLKSSLVMLVLFAVAGSSVAQAQVCDARSTSNTVRAEGITEVVADLKVRCRVEGVFGLDPKDPANITVQLNTNITNSVTVADDGARNVEIADVADLDAPAGLSMVHMTAKMGGSILVESSDAGGTLNAVTETTFDTVTLSDDGTTLTWKLTADQINLNGTDDDTGFNLVISGIRANASSLGVGQDIVATVFVAGVSPANTSGPVKLAAVKTGLDIPVEVATGDQCADTETTATITIKEGEGVASAINDSSRFVITFRGIPEGVTVTVPTSVESMDTPEIDAEENGVPVAAVTDTFGIKLAAGIASGTDGDGVVDLSAAGTGEVVYDVVDASVDDTGFIDATDPERKDEWVTLEVTFAWESADLMPANAMGTVNVSFDPVSASLGDTFADERGAPVPRFVASDNTQKVLDISLCTTTLLFPYVLNTHGFDTGLAITNASSEAGSCTIALSGSDAPSTDSISNVISAGEQLIWGLSSGNSDENVVPAAGFRGYITATCGFRDAYGYAFITDGFGGDRTLAQGYLAEVLP